MFGTFYTIHDIKALVKSDLKPNALRIFILLCTLSDDKGIITERVSFDYLGAELGIARTTISRSVTELKKAGILTIEVDLGKRAYYTLLPAANWKL